MAHGPVYVGRCNTEYRSSKEYSEQPQLSGAFRNVSIIRLARAEASKICFHNNAPCSLWYGAMPEANRGLCLRKRTPQPRHSAEMLLS